MNQILKIIYKAKGEIREGYFIETRRGLVPIRIPFGEFQHIDKEKIISKKNVSINKITGRIE